MPLGGWRGGATGAGAAGGEARSAALAPADRYDWLVVTSPNGARGVADGLARPTTARLAAIGPKTAQPLSESGHPVNLIPDRAVAEGLLEAFPPSDGTGRVLLARAATARHALPHGPRGAGGEVDVVVAYRNVVPDVDPEIREQARSADLVTFTAQSTVRRYHDLAGGPTPATAACIGPISAAVARQLGFTVVEAEPPSVAGLVDSVLAWASASSPPG